MRAFQARHNLEGDGKVGPRTIAALERVAAAPNDVIDTGPNQRRAGALPAPTPPPAPSTGGSPTPRRGLGANPALPEGLSASARATVGDAASGATAPRSQEAVRTLMANPAYRSLSAPAQARLLSTLDGPTPTGMIGGMLGSPNSPAYRDVVVANRARAATALLETPAARRLGAADRGRLVDVYAASPAGRGALTRLAGSGGADRLSTRDLRGGTMLSSLHQLATGPLGRGIDRADVLRSTMGEVENPTTIEQRGQGTCAATSVTLRVAERSPAEYARIVSGLASQAGTATTLAGDTLRRVPGSVADQRSGRSQSERLIQDSFMDFANGDYRYNVAADNSGAAGGGLNVAEVTRLQTSVMGQEYRTVTTTGRQVTRDAGFFEQRYRNLRNNLDRALFRENPNAPMALLRREVSAGRSTVIGMRWGQENHSGHAVVVERIASGRVYFQNPHGNATHGQAVGSSLSPPPRRVEAGNVQSMLIADFQSRLHAVSIPA